MALSPDQKQALESVVAWLNARNSPVLTLGGYAGTGKTSVIAALRVILRRQRPKWRVAFAAYTGKASRVLADRLTRLKAQTEEDSVSTLHALLYSPLSDSRGDLAGWQRKPSIPFDLIIVDEASMVSREIWRDVMSYGIPVLAVGDHGQLPPIGDVFSVIENPDIALTHIHRQAEKSPIIAVATMARETGIIPVEKFGPGVEKIAASESDAQLRLEEFWQNLKSDTMFLTGFNSTRVRLNQTIRGAQYRNPDCPEAGDLLVGLKNDWDAGVFNGMLVEVQKVGKVAENALGIGILPLELMEVGTNRELSVNATMQGFNATKEALEARAARKRKNAPQWFDYGYALTVHKAQGSQARRVIVIEERMPKMNDDEWRRWLYTAVTRAEEELYIFG